MIYLFFDFLFFIIQEEGIYKAETILFNHLGKLIDENTLQLGDIKPFSILSNAEVNNLDKMEGYGLPKIYNAIPLFQALDLCFYILYGDLDKGEKLVFINELLACLQEKTDGTMVLTPQQKDLFILLGEKLPQSDTLIQEYNPEIRIEAVTKAFELVLSLISMQFGYGSKKYTFENGKITMATESMRADAITFQNVPILLKWYLMEKYNLSEKEVKEYLQEEKEDDMTED